MRKTRKLVTEVTETVKDDRIEKLETAISKIAEIEPDYKQLEKQIKSEKETVKSLCIDLKYDSYESKCGKKISITHVDKSFLDEFKTLEWLRNNGLEKYIKTKEYFDEAELAMAIVNQEIKAEDLAPFTVQKEELRLNIK